MVSRDTGQHASRIFFPSIFILLSFLVFFAHTSSTVFGAFPMYVATLLPLPSRGFEATFSSARSVFPYFLDCF